MHIKQRCDFCKEIAIYDALTRAGVHAYVCQVHFDKYALGEPDSFTHIAPKPEITERVCSRCNKTKPIGEFYSAKDVHGVLRYRLECKECTMLATKLNSLRKDRKKK